MEQTGNPSTFGNEDPLANLSLEQQNAILWQNLQDAACAIQERDQQLSIQQAKDVQIAGILRGVFDAQQTQREQKISRKSFQFTKFDGRKDGRIVLAWLSQFDDYFAGEPFLEQEKIKCATNHMTDKATLWWNVLRKSATRPTTWDEFIEKVKDSFLPPQFHLQT